jgi:Glycolipid 2-alpha-mannosyltransferase
MAKGLEVAAREFVRLYGITPRHKSMWQDAFPSGTVNIFNNNFEIGSVAFFRRPEVRQWVEYVLEQGGIFRYRWGDAPLRLLTIAIFARENEIVTRKQLGIQYCHPLCVVKDGKVVYLW